MTLMSDWQPWQMDPLGSPASLGDDPQSSHRERVRKQAFQRKLEMQVLREKTLAEAQQVGHAQGVEQGYAQGLSEGRPGRRRGVAPAGAADVATAAGAVP